MNETPTPRTDAAMFCIGCGADGNGTPHDVVDADFARQLERELAEAKHRADRFELIATGDESDFEKLVAEREQLQSELAASQAREAHLKSILDAPELAQ